MFLVERQHRDIERQIQARGRCGRPEQRDRSLFHVEEKAVHGEQSVEHDGCRDGNRGRVCHVGDLVRHEQRQHVPSVHYGAGHERYAEQQDGAHGDAHQ